MSSDPVVVRSEAAVGNAFPRSGLPDHVFCACLLMTKPVTAFLLYRPRLPAIPKGCDA